MIAQIMLILLGWQISQICPKKIPPCLAGFFCPSATLRTSKTTNVAMD